MNEKNKNSPLKEKNVELSNELKIIEEELEKLRKSLRDTEEKLTHYSRTDVSENGDILSLSEQIEILKILIAGKSETLKEIADSIHGKNNMRKAMMITYKLLEGGEKKEVLLCSNSNPLDRRVSFDSPLGIALNEKNKGEIALVRVNNPYRIIIIDKIQK